MMGDDQLALGAAALGLTLTRAQRGQLDQYLALLEKWNRVYNLTAIRSRSRMVTHHLLDSLAVLPHVRAPRVLDVGSGAGLPGIPLAVANPALEVTLLEANHKKSAFLTQAIGELHLANARIVTERVESWRTDARFDTIVSRAFADLAEFVGSSRHLLARGGVFAAMKGVHPFEEIERLPRGYAVVDVVKLDVPGLDAERHLVLVGESA
jgi:16S rRNA (guanine527-N7)-methyltransferase